VPDNRPAKMEVAEYARHSGDSATAVTEADAQPFILFVSP
jgi:hypothetical protein